MMIIILFIFTFLLSFANGANDNFKGVATLFGSGVTNYKKALSLATLTTFLGSLCAVLIAQKLVLSFSGKGLVSNQLILTENFSLAVVFGASLTVLLASQLGFPISTTHALVGALVGTGLIASDMGVNFEKLKNSFFIPLILTPLLAVFLTTLFYFLSNLFRTLYDSKKNICICIGTVETGVAAFNNQNTMDIHYQLPLIKVAHLDECVERTVNSRNEMNIKKIINPLHFLSAGIVSFARGLNDTPKIAALLLLGKATTPTLSILLIGIFIALGGWFWAKRVAETLSHRVTTMSAEQGLVANLVTGLIVILASKLGYPASTTHVSCGALIGIGATTKQAYWDTILKISFAWCLTLPIAGFLSIVAFYTLSRWS